VEGQEKQEAAQAVWQALRQRQNPILYFGSIAFKGQPQPADLRTMTRLACLYMDVVTTSGEATGRAAEPAKLQVMHGEAGETPLGIASGITPDNVRAYLVASGISVDFHSLSPERVKSLNDLIIAAGAQRFKPL
jgi:phosphoribosylanthranilate isomerase